MRKLVSHIVNHLEVVDFKAASNRLDHMGKASRGATK